MAALSGMKSICEYVNRSAPTVLKWIKTKEFPAGRLCGGNWESDSRWIDEWRDKRIAAECREANARW